MDKLNLTLMLDQKNVHDVLRVFRKYGSQLPLQNLGINDEIVYHVQWSQPGEPAMMMTYTNGGDGIINIHYEPMGFALLNKKSDVPFDWSVRLTPEGKDLFETVRLPKDFISARWLKERGNRLGTPGETNETFFVLMFLCAKCMSTWFGYGMEKTSTNGRDLVLKPKKDFFRLASEGFENMKEKVRVEHLYDGWDTVTMDEKQFNKMAEYVDDVGMKLTLETVFLDRFAFRYLDDEGFSDIYYYTAMNDGILVVVDSDKPRKKRFSFCVIMKEKVDPDTKEIGYNSELRTDVSCGEREIEWLHKEMETGISCWEWIVYSFFGINTFMLNYRDVSVDVREVECKQSEKVKHGGKVKERTVVRMFKQYTLKKDWKRAVARKKAEYHCLAWSVRGHIRRYKNGKTVFVRPYIKGKEKDKYVPKDYIPIPPEVQNV